MSRLRRATSGNLTGSIAVVAILALSLAGCAGDGKLTPKASPGSTASSGRTEMISAVAGTVAGCGIGRSPSFPSVLATGVGGVQPSTASDSSLIAPDEPDAAVDPGDAFGVSLPSPAQ